MDIQSKIQEQITQNPVVLYMKGTPAFPQCGFSSRAVKLLKEHGVKDFLAVDVLMDPEIREGIKQYSNWPTIPQLYIKGEFIGGSDIMKDLSDRGELQPLLEQVS